MASAKLEKETRLNYTIQSFAGQLFAAILPEELFGRQFQFSSPLIPQSDNFSHFYFAFDLP